MGSRRKEIQLLQSVQEGRSVFYGRIMDNVNGHMSSYDRGIFIDSVNFKL